MADTEGAPIVSDNGKEIVFKGAGNSHFSFVKPGGDDPPGWYVTTQIPDLRQNIPISVHDLLPLPLLGR